MVKEIIQTFSVRRPPWLRLLWHFQGLELVHIELNTLRTNVVLLLEAVLQKGVDEGLLFFFRSLTQFLVFEATLSVLKNVVQVFFNKQ